MMAALPATIVNFFLEKEREEALFFIFGCFEVVMVVL